MTKIPIDLKFEIIEYNNKSFSKGRCYIAYHGKNRNGSYISKESFEKALPSIFGIPIVGEYLKEIQNEINTNVEGNYSDHEGVYNAPTPIGFIPSDSKCFWETQSDNREYLVVEGIILWTKRYPEAKNIFDKNFNQSMEISIDDDEESSYFDEKDKLYHIEKFSFEALCVLGTDCIRNEDGSVSYRGKADVEPCFEGSRFDTYSMKLEFKKEYENMLKEFKQFSLSNNNQKQGGNVMDKKLELLKKYSHLNKEMIENLKKDIEKYSLEDLEKELKKNEEIQFSLSVNQIYNAIDKELNKRKVIAKDWWGDSYETYEFHRIDLITEENILIVIDYNWENYYGIPYTMNGDIAVLDYDNKKPYIEGDWRPVSEGTSMTLFSKIKDSYNERINMFINKATEKAKTEFNIKETEEYKALNSKLEEIQEKYSKVQLKPDEKLQLEYDGLQKKFNQISEELEDIQGKFGIISVEKDNLSKDFELVNSEKETIQNELNSYKLKEKELEVDKLFSKEEFSCLTENKEYKELKTKAIEMDLTNVEEKLFVMLGKFSALNFSNNNHENSQIMNFGIYKYKLEEENDDEEPDYKKKWC